MVSFSAPIAAGLLLDTVEETSSTYGSHLLTADIGKLGKRRYNTTTVYFSSEDLMIKKNFDILGDS